MVFENGEFPGVRAVGSKPVYIIPESEVMEKLQARNQASQLRQQKREEREARIEQRRVARQAVTVDS